jgi:hypothetical protein
MLPRYCTHPCRQLRALEQQTCKQHAGPHEPWPAGGFACLLSSFCCSSVARTRPDIWPLTMRLLPGVGAAGPVALAVAAAVVAATGAGDGLGGGSSSTYTPAGGQRQVVTVLTPLRAARHQLQ